MEEEFFVFGDILNHRYLSKDQELIVIAQEGEDVTVRYSSQGVFYTQTLSIYEVTQPYPPRNITRNNGK